MKIKLKATNWVRRELHRPCLKVLRAAARFVRYREPELQMTFSHAYRRGGSCSGRRTITIIPPEYQHRTDFLWQAFTFFETACHELSHALDLIEHGYWQPGRRAEDAVLDRLYDLTGGRAGAEHHGWAETVKLPQATQNAILGLAIVLEDCAAGWLKTKRAETGPLDWLN